MVGQDSDGGDDDVRERALADLRARFGYMFEPTKEWPDFFRFNPAIGDGWMPIFVRLCEAVDRVLIPEEKPRFRWHQVKQKYAGLRAYWGLEGRALNIYVDVTEPGVGVTTGIYGPADNLAARLMPLIRTAEDEAARTCETCGTQPASVDRTGGYLMTLCRVHAQARRKHEGGSDAS